MRSKTPLTPELIYAAAVDEANSSMRVNGRVAWNDEDSGIFIQTYKKLFWIFTGDPDQ